MSVAQTTAEQQAGQGNSPEAEVQQESRLSAGQVHSLSQQAEGNEAKQKRTPGLKFVDGAVYAGVTHFGVFAISVVFTFLTRHGHNMGGKIPNMMHSRNEKFIQALGNRGVSRDRAADFSVITWSFLDGCLLLPLVRALESQRTRIAYTVDKVMGKVPKKTTPDGKVVDDMSIYENEPKQSWASVIAGRVAAAGLVVPIAMGLDKWHPFKDKLKEDGTRKNVNDILMRDVGYKIADKIQEKSAGKWIMKTADNYFEKRHDRLSEGTTKDGKPLKPATPFKMKLPEFMEVNMFETVWTAICAAVLFVTSRSAARLIDKRKEQKAEAAHTQPQAGGEKPADQTHQSVKHEEKADQPIAQKADMPHSQKAEQPANKANAASSEEKAWADLVERNPKLAEQLAKTVESQLARQQERSKRQGSALVRTA